MRHKNIGLFTFYALLISLCIFGSAAEARAAGVSLVATPTSQTVTVGQTTAYTIKINRDNYVDKVTLSATGLPSGVTATFSPNVTTATSSTLKLQTSTSTPIGIFNINVKATANGISIAPIVVKLTTRPVPSISLTVTPPAQSIVVGQSTFYDIAISRLNYDGMLTLSAENVPTGVTVLFDPETTYGSSSRMYLYSNNLPFQSQSFGMYVRARNFYDGIDNLQFVQLHANPGLGWVAQFESPFNGAAFGDFATDVTYDSAGNVYVTGYTYDSSAADFNSWIAKYDWAGNQLWLRPIQNLLEDIATDVFSDAAGNVYVAGNMRGQLHDIFVVKVDANGNQQLPAFIFSTFNEEGQSGMQFGVNSSGNTTLTAVTRVRSTNGPRDSTNEPTTVVEYDVTRFVFDANFNQTNTTLVTNATKNPKDLAVGGDGSVYVLSEDSSNLGPFIGLNNRFVFTTSQVQKFNGPNGANYLSAPFEPSDADANKASRLKVDANGNVFAVGIKYGRFKTGSLDFLHVWMIKLNAVGGLVWQTRNFGGGFLTEIRGLDVDANGNVYAAGLTWGSLRGTNPESGAPNDPNNPGARTDAWFGTFAGADGTQRYLSQFNVRDHDGFNAVKVGTGGAIYLAGYSLNFRPNWGFQDALLVRCTPFLCGFVQ
jgi:hypothetical protein